MTSWRSSPVDPLRRAGRRFCSAAVLSGMLAGMISLTAVSIDVFAPSRSEAGGPTEYQAVTPRRILDTRAGLGTTIAGTAVAGSAIPITIPPDATSAVAVALNVTITDPAGDGYATVYPCGITLPLASNVNFGVGQTVPNLVIAKPGADGQVCVVTNVAANVVVDFEGWFPLGSYDPLDSPQRVLDTRQGGAHRLRPGVEVQLLTADNATDGGDDDVAAVANVTAAGAQSAGYLAVYPCGAIPPVASNLNFTPGVAVANLTVSRLGTGMGVCALASAATDVVVDMQGTLSSASNYTPVAPVRMVDTRSPIGMSSVGRLRAGRTIPLSFPVMSGIPSVVDSVVVNVTATDSTGSGYLTVFPCGATEPLASNVNIAPGGTRPNLVVTPVGPDGTICLTGNVDANVIVDLQGWFGGRPSPAPVSAPIRQHIETGPGVTAGYLAYLPAGYTSSPGRTWPTIVFLHGSAQTGPGTGDSLDGVGSNGLPLLFETGTEPASAAGFVVFAPQFPDGSNSPVRLRQWLSQVLPRYAVDRDRVYLTGLSAGGYYSFDYVGAVGDSNEFAAIVPIAGGFPHPIVCDNWRHTPVWAFHGEADPTVNPLGSIQTVQAVNANCAPVERMRLTTYPGVGHDAWDMTYDLSAVNAGRANTAHDQYDIDIFVWMLAHVRSRYR